MLSTRVLHTVLQVSATSMSMSGGFLKTCSAISLADSFFLTATDFSSGLSYSLETLNSPI